MKNIKLKIFKITQSIPKSQKGSYQNFIIWFCKKAILKTRIFKSLHWQFSIFENLLLLIIKTIQKS